MKKMLITGGCLIFLFIVAFGRADSNKDEIDRLTTENSKLHKKLLYVCVHNMQELSLSLLIYASDNKGHFPANLKVLEPALRNRGNSLYLFCCPLTDTRLQTWDEVNTKGDYLYLPERIMKPEPTQKHEDVLLIEKEFNHEGDSQMRKNCLFIDGHIEAHSESSEIIKNMKN